jgi:hypothetical protein
MGGGFSIDPVEIKVEEMVLCTHSFYKMWH